MVVDSREVFYRMARNMFRIALSASAILLAISCASQLPAQSSAPDFEATGAPLVRQPVDPQIAGALGQVSPESVRRTDEKLVSFQTRSTLSSMEKGLPPGEGILAAADWIHARFEEISAGCGHCLDVREDQFTQQPTEPGFGGGKSRFSQPTLLRNIYAVLRGADPAQAKRIYLVTGHYDTRVTDVMNARAFAPGANDDTSGTAVSLECARVLSKLRFPATIVFVAVAGEEQGLNGSHHMAELMGQMAQTEGWRLEGVLNNDIVGGDTTPGDALQQKSLVRVFSQGINPNAPLAEIKAALALGAENDTSSRELARAVLDVARTYIDGQGGEALKPVMELRLDRYLRGGDHSSFSAAGFPAVRFTEWRENYNHQHQDVRTEGGVEFGDLLKFVDFGYVARVARLNAATLATLASSPGVPQNVRVVTRELGNNSTLRWDAPAAAGSDVRYQILWRETSATDWKFGGDAARYSNAARSGDTAATHSATLPISKDNVFFGVRACDGAGHCSEAVAPVPER